ncbi:MAG: bifunctional UDP-N-acetylmuramoyl-tripeptide:D-alanyl-D-alanine ligase/alanine racemase [Flavobacteriales bacterium]
MRIDSHHLAEILSGTWFGLEENIEFSKLVTDTRTDVHHLNNTIFIALKGPNFDAHQFLNQAHQKGIHYFIVSELPKYLDQNCAYILVDDTHLALNQLAQYQRSKLHYPLIGITGSNGKTIVKEWLNHLLSKAFKISRSPKSYNSKIGLALSLIQAEPDADFGLFEVGISQPNEMEAQEQLLKPDFGVFTILGDAHQQYFESKTQKLKEKFKLFTHTKALVSSVDQESIRSLITSDEKSKHLTWSTTREADIQLIEKTYQNDFTSLKLKLADQIYTIQIPFQDEISCQNALTCFSTLKMLGVLKDSVLERFESLPELSMRMERRAGIYQSVLINDSYSNDGLALQFGLQELSKEKGKKGLIISDFAEFSKAQYKSISNLINKQQLNILITIGSDWKKETQLSADIIHQFESLETFKTQINLQDFTQHTLLIKGARKFKFEQLVQFLSNKPHGSYLEVDLDALSSNVQFFKSKLKPQTGMYLMLKAFSYGVGSIELAKHLEQFDIQGIIVAYVNEGIALRQAQITCPIVVMNSQIDQIDLMCAHQLEPELYSIEHLSVWKTTLEKKNIKAYPIHLKFDTGMHRLGFLDTDIQPLSDYLIHQNQLRVSSVFSHFVDSRSENFANYTQNQFDAFNSICERLELELKYTFTKHISNSNAIVQYPEFQLDAVRLGIGLFGLNLDKKWKIHCKSPLSLKTKILQIKTLKKGEGLGYSHQFVAEKETRIATLAIGYADGLLRSYGKAGLKLYINQNPCPIIGAICMDMCMIDLGNLKAHIGDEVVVFDPDTQDLDDLAHQVGTIPYEILCSLSDRIERRYNKEW